MVAMVVGCSVVVAMVVGCSATVVGCSEVLVVVATSTFVACSFFKDSD